MGAVIARECAIKENGKYSTWMSLLAFRYQVYGRIYSKYTLIRGLINWVLHQR